jgi:hypothetical protein
LHEQQFNHAIIGRGFRLHIGVTRSFGRLLFAANQQSTA